MSWLVEDLQHAFRFMLRHGSFTLFTITILATGFALCIFMLSFLNGSLRAPMPFHKGEDLRRIDAVQNGITQNGDTMFLHEFDYLQQRAGSWSTLDVFSQGQVAVALDDNTTVYTVHRVTETFFRVSEASPLLGRIIQKQDISEASSPVVVIGYGPWQSLFAGDSDVIGKQIRVDGILTTVIGVMDADYRFPDSATMWLPYRQRSVDFKPGEGGKVTIYGLLADGVTDAKARQELHGIMAELAERHPRVNKTRSATARTFQIAIMGNGVETITALVEASVALILLLACVNVSNLLYSRAIERSKETAIRMAVGAPRQRLITQTMLESFVICVAATAISVVIAAIWLASVNGRLDTLLAFETPFWWRMNLSTFSIVTAILLAVITTLLTGMLPAWKTSTGNMNQMLRDGTQGAQSQSSSRLSTLIVIFEIFLTCALLIVASGMINAIMQQYDTDYGARVEGVLQVELRLEDQQYASEQAKIQFYGELKSQLRSEPDVQGVTLASYLPSEYAWYANVFIDTRDYTTGNQDFANVVTVDRDYFDTFEISLLEGRGFDTRDRLDSPLVAVVTKKFADSHWPEGEALGRRFKIKDQTGDFYTVVGVVDQVLHGQELDEFARRGTVYRSIYQQPRQYIKVALHTEQSPYALGTPLMEKLAKLDRKLVPYNVIALQDAIDKRLAHLSFVNELFMVFAGISLILAFTGIYGVMSRAIVQKRHEIAIKRGRCQRAGHCQILPDLRSETTTVGSRHGPAHWPPAPVLSAENRSGELVGSCDHSGTDSANRDHPDRCRNPGIASTAGTACNGPAR